MGYELITQSPYLMQQELISFHTETKKGPNKQTSSMPMHITTTVINSSLVEVEHPALTLTLKS